MRAASLGGILLAALLAFGLLANFAGEAASHDVRPAYLQIDPLGADEYKLTFRTPILSGVPLPVVLTLPEETKSVTPPRVQTLPGSRVEHRVVAVPGGLAGKFIGFAGLEATITDVLVRIGGPDGEGATTLVRPSRPVYEVAPDRGRLAVALTYFGQGVEHILYGLDHLLFVATLLLLIDGWRTAVKTVTAFTIAHSITLALATLGWVRLPPGPVEILIAASIVLVAVEAARREKGAMSATIRWPYIVAFAFGLLHGFGFAGALRAIGLPAGDIPLALLMFNLGVEAGQLAFIAVVVLSAGAIAKLIEIPRHSRIALIYGAGIVSTSWCLDRIVQVFS